MDVFISNLKLLLNYSKLNIFGLLKLQVFLTYKTRRYCLSVFQ